MVATAVGATFLHGTCPQQCCKDPHGATKPAQGYARPRLGPPEALSRPLDLVPELPQGAPATPQGPQTPETVVSKHVNDI